MCVCMLLALSHLSAALSAAPRPSTYFATTLGGLEPVLAAELSSPEIGASAVSCGRLGVHFEGGPEVGARAVLWSRTALRVMELLERREGVHTQASLYDFARAVRWSEVVASEQQTLSVGAVLSLDRARASGKMRAGDWVCRSCNALVFASKDECYQCGEPRDADTAAAARRRLEGGSGRRAGGGEEGGGGEPLTHTHFSALTVKNAACDALREERGWRPSVDRAEPDVPLHLHVHRGEARLYRVLSGAGSLHRRGYRSGEAVHKAAMKESLAAAMLLHAGYDGTSPLCDPMCGSGTLLVEAALIATRTAPGLLRASPPPLVKWGGGRHAAAWEEAWEEAVAEARAVRRDAAPAPIMANEVHPGALALARRSAAAAGVEALIDFSHGCCSGYVPPHAPSLVVSNPPWGGRLDADGAADSWAVLGEWLKREGREGRAAAHLLSGSRELTRHLRLRASSRTPVEQAGDSLRILRYDLAPRPAPEVRAEGEGRGVSGQTRAAAEAARSTEATPSRPAQQSPQIEQPEQPGEGVPSEQLPSQQLAALKVPELKELLRARSLPLGGVKADLIARLQQRQPQQPQ